MAASQLRGLCLRGSSGLAVQSLEALLNQEEPGLGGGKSKGSNWGADTPNPGPEDQRGEAGGHEGPALAASCGAVTCAVGALTSNKQQ